MIISFNIKTHFKLPCGFLFTSNDLINLIKYLWISFHIKLSHQLRIYGFFFPSSKHTSSTFGSWWKGRNVDNHATGTGIRIPSSALAGQRPWRWAVPYSQQIHYRKCWQILNRPINWLTIKDIVKFENTVKFKLFDWMI